MKKNDIKLALKITLLLVLGGALVYFSIGGRLRSGAVIPDVAEVGDFSLTDQDVNYILGIERAYGNDKADEISSLVRLITQESERAVADKMSLEPSRDEIKSLSDHVDSTTKAPEILQKAKNVFGTDRKSYEKLYLSPIIVSKKLRSFWSGSKEIHNAERKQIEEAYGRISAGETMKIVADEMKLEYSKPEYSEKPEEVPDALKQYNVLPAESPLVKIIKELKIGELYKNIVEDDQQYSVIRFIGKKGDKSVFETVSVKKFSYENWYQGELDKIKIEILNPSLLEQIKTRYPDWVKKMNIK